MSTIYAPQLRGSQILLCNTIKGKKNHSKMLATMGKVYSMSLIQSDLIPVQSPDTIKNLKIREDLYF